MPYLVRVVRTRWVNEKGRRVKPGTPGAKKVKEKSRQWYGAGLPGWPAEKRTPALATDKAVAARMLNDLVRDLERGRVGMPSATAGRKLLTELLDEFTEAVKLGLASRSKRARRIPDPKQVAILTTRVREILDGCKFTAAGDLNDAAATKLASYLGERVLLRDRKAGGMSRRTATFYLAAARRFAWWLSTKQLPVRADLFDGIPGFDPDTDPLHARRDVTADEMGRLLGAARQSPRVIRGLTGEDRFHLYLTAFSTGYRAGELAELVPACFLLDEVVPVVVLAGKLTKNRKAAAQPVSPAVAGQLRAYLVGKPDGKPVWPGTWAERPVSVRRRDLAAADVPYRVDGPDGPRYADFHALRHSYLSALSAAGVGAKEMQELARHSDPRLTLGRYVHTDRAALGAAASRLAIPGVNGDGGNTLAKFSRAELETLVVGLASVVAALGVVLGAGMGAGHGESTRDYVGLAGTGGKETRPDRAA